MTPNDIDVLLNHFKEGSQDEEIESGDIRQSIQELMSDGLLQDLQGTIRITRKGEALVTVLCNTPMPRQLWVDYKGDVIDV